MEQFNSLISIVMPAYNCAKYISLAVKSVIQQTYENWELLIIDDGSTDSTKDIISNFIKMDKRIKLFSNDKNIGVSETRNKGVELSNGTWIAFLDSDDMWKPKKLEKQIKIINKYNAEFVFSGACYIDDENNFFKGNFSVPSLVTFEMLKKHNVISCSSVLLEKKYMLDFQMENDNIHEDYALWLKILRTGVNAYSVNEDLLIYRISKNSKSGNKLKTFKMTYNVFRFVGMGRINSCYYTSLHIRSSIKKYFEIYFKARK